MKSKIKSAASIMGSKGGKKTAKKGPDHYRKLQKKGVAIRKLKNKQTNE